MEHFKILVVGQDITYYRKLEDQFRKFLQESIVVFETITVSDKHNLNKVLSLVLEKKPHVAFIDQDINVEKMQKLIQFLSKHDYYQQNGLIGLASQVATKYSAPWPFLENGAHAFYCKSIEVEDVIFQTLSRYYYKKPILQNYFQKNVATKQLFKMPLRVGLYHSGGVHVEGFLNCKKSSSMVLEFHEKIINGNFLCKVDNVSDKNCYYAYPSNADLSVDFVHSIEPRYEEVVEHSHDGFSKKNLYVKDSIKQEMGQLHKKMKDLKSHWGERINSLMADAVPKYLRLMVVDPQLSIYNLSDEDYDIYPFSIRVHRHIVEKHFIKERPDVVCWIIPSEVHAGTVEQHFMTMVDIIQKQNDYAPVIVLFNSPFSHEFYSKYSAGLKVVVDAGPIDLGLILHYASVAMEEEEIYKKEKAKDGHFPDKNDPESFALAHVEANVIGLTESYVLFTCGQELIDGTHLYWPGQQTLSMMVMQMPQYYNGKKYFVGFFQALNENDKRLLRGKLHQNSKVA